MQKVNCVLLVDDDEVTNYLSERVIKKIDLSRTIKKTQNGEDALLYLTKHCCNFDDIYFPELIILDNQMPEMNGIEFLQSINQINLNASNRIKIIVLTAFPNKKDEETMRKLGIKALIQKPLTEEKLSKVIAEI
ncbi:MAG: response regulator [Cytophagaceae bacterium]